jgi:ferric-dicitrate binding protein FerR (iron transport regulator)
MDRFEELHQRYLDNTLSREEYKEFAALIQDEENAKRLESLMDQSFVQSEATEVMTPAEDVAVFHAILPLKKERSLLPRMLWAAAAVLTLAAFSYFWLYAPADQTTPAATTETLADAADGEWMIYSGKDFVTLPDGTKVTMNEGSELKYHRTFGETTREITMKGEAYFDVYHDVARPFIVRTGNVSVRVLGTAFNVRTTQEQEVRVTVTRGKVQVADEEQHHTYGVLAGNQEMAVNTATQKAVRTDAESKQSLAWTNRFLILDDVRFAEAAEIIGTHYHVKVTFLNPALKECGLNAKFINGEELPDVLEMIAKAMGVTYEIKGETVMIGGKGCQ